MKASSGTYSLLARLVHWTNALLIIFLYFSGEAAEHGGGLGYQAHVVLGLVCLALTLVQIGLYLFGPKPAALEGLSWFRKQAIHWNHRLILLATFIATASGAFILLGSDRFEELHESASLPIIVLLLMHVAGVMVYQFTKGNSLGRMAPMIFGRAQEK
ncbi:MAG: cytochrome b561 [Cellvibrionaceae bacterium]|jgi:cytochrome b561